jgi:hypothetical protein
VKNCNGGSFGYRQSFSSWVDPFFQLAGRASWMPKTEHNLRPISATLSLIS